jgi:UDP-N-acetyl-D-galactosamine dehydrogenase
VAENAIAIIGVGYVGLPLAIGLANHHADIVAFDIDEERIRELTNGVDRNDPNKLKKTYPKSLKFTSDVSKISSASAYIVTVPTPIDNNRLPDLTLLENSCKIIASVISKDNLVIIESTVYPGVTEEVCGPLIQEVSGLLNGRDFSLGYSPERINPGDLKNNLESVVKIIAGQDPETLERMEAIYAPVITAGLYPAKSIQVAEAAKIVENVQRDLNIALMNELAMIFDRMGIRTADVLDAAATKWNFQKFTPGLVGGHCIGVDPYYLISKAEGLGYYPELIRAARRLNNGLAEHISQKTVDLIVSSGRSMNDSKIGILGLTFKENVADVRNSQSPIIVNELSRYGATILCHDPYVDHRILFDNYGIQMSSMEMLTELDALVIIVPHLPYLEKPMNELMAMLKKDGIFIDVKSAFDLKKMPELIRYWSL